MNRNQKVTMKKRVNKSLAVAMAAMVGMTPAAAAPVFAGTQTSKDETVYVNAKANGDADNITVSDHLSGLTSGKKIKDNSDLAEIENVKGDEKFTGKGTTLKWESTGEDIYYQGKSDKQLPVGVKFTYYLDGKEISPEALAGKSGKLKIHIQYTNNTEKNVKVGKKTETLQSPFVMMTGVILPEDVFSNVTVDNGRIVDDGARTIVLGFGMPGLKESLNLTDMKEKAKDAAGKTTGETAAKAESKIDSINIPDSVEISADVKDFHMDPTFTVALTDVFNNVEFDSIASTDDLNDKIKELEDATVQLVDGSRQLADGASTLDSSYGQMDDGIRQLSDGIRKAASGIDQYTDGVSQVNNGVLQLNQGASQLDSNSSALKQGASQLASGAETLNNGVQQLAGGITQKGTGLADGVNAYTDGVSKLNAGIQQMKTQVQGDHLENLGLKDGAKTLAEGTKTYTDGVHQLKTGAGQLADEKNGLPALALGASSLKEGIDQYTEGVQKLADGVDKMAGSEGLPALQKGVKDLTDGVSGLSKAVGDNADKIIGGAETISGGVAALNEGVNEFASKGCSSRSAGECRRRDSTRLCRNAGEQTWETDSRR